MIGRLNEYMRQIIVNGQYSESGETTNILSKHNLHILVMILQKCLDSTWSEHSCWCG